MKAFIGVFEIVWVCGGEAESVKRRASCQRDLDDEVSKEEWGRQHLVDAREEKGGDARSVLRVRRTLVGTPKTECRPMEGRSEVQVLGKPKEGL